MNTRASACLARRASVVVATTFFNLNIQPVIPFSVSERWKLIARTILPLDSIPTPDGERHTGTGDIQEQLFFTPAESGSLIWGLGPVFSLPTATAAPVETGSWAIGPGLVLIHNVGPFVLGALFSRALELRGRGGATRLDGPAQVKAGKPFFCYFNSTRMHGFARLSPAADCMTGLELQADGTSSTTVTWVSC